MTRATLSDMLHHPGALTDAEVAELEKLAESFPYCQTAHTLLAKALHDRGSMLAGQKLRRAATYAADRRVLRRLLMAPPVELAVVPEPAPAEKPTLAVDAAGTLVQTQENPTPEPVAEKPAPALATPPAAVAPEEVQPEAPAAEAAPVATSEALAETDIETPAETVAEAAGEPIETVPVEPAPAAPESVAPAAPAEPETEPEAEPAAEPVITIPATPPVIADFDLVPDTSPGIEELRLFESEEERGDYPALGVLVDDLPTALIVSAAPVVPPLETDPAVRYFIGSSRLGPELVAADEWPTGEGDLLAPWLWAAPPDARWTEHAAAHEPPRPAYPRRPFEHQFALIDRFLREKPRLRTMDPTQPLPEKVPDLAQRSARDSGALVSESMARILARQGKTARAVAMYEQLQVKFPEKAAIFAAQIAALRASEA